MSRLRFWTILLGTEPTAFRASEQNDLLPTLKQLQRRHPEAVMKWFERGQLFDSPLEAAAEWRRLERERRPPTWRPGGEHRDPRERFALSRDEKRRRFKVRQIRSTQAAGPGGGSSPTPSSRTQSGDRSRPRSRHRNER
ncbi:MAG: hypothetical protein AB7I50_03920 [Vicinamibacterales bacterium]